MKEYPADPFNHYGEKVNGRQSKFAMNGISYIGL